MKKSKLNLEVIMGEATGEEHRIYRHVCSQKAFHTLSKNVTKESYCVPLKEEELTLLECIAPKPWMFYNYFQMTGFWYTGIGVAVTGIISLKEKADFIDVSIEVIDKRTGEVLDTKEINVKSVYNCDFEELFQVREKEPDELLATVTAEWKQGGRTEKVSAIRKNCICKSFPQTKGMNTELKAPMVYTHIYPKKENSPVIFGDPEIHPHEPDYKKYESQDDIVVALLRLPEKRTDCDYICGFERGPQGYPYLSVPSEGVIDLRNRGGIFVGVISAHCILTRYGNGGGATLLARNEVERFENADFDFNYNADRSVLTYQSTKNWRQEFDYPSGWDRVYRFQYNLLITYEYKIGRKPNLDTLSVSSNHLFCDYHIPLIRVMYGCLSKDSMILMADGSRKRIDALRIGDRIMGGKAGTQVQMVVNIWKGLEEFLYRIVTDQHTLSLSETHPVLTTEGVFKAVELKEDMMVCLADGSCSKIIAVEKYPYDDLVYNLNLEDENEPYIVAEGMIVGDMELQNRMPS